MLLAIGSKADETLDWRVLMHLRRNA